jgi:hypothetical protein
MTFQYDVAATRTLKRGFFKHNADDAGFIEKHVRPCLREIFSPEACAIFIEFDAPPEAIFWMLQGAVDGRDDKVLLHVFMREFIATRLEETTCRLPYYKMLALRWLNKMDGAFFPREPTVAEFAEMLRTHSILTLALSPDDLAFRDAFYA